MHLTQEKLAGLGLSFTEECKSTNDLQNFQIIYFK